MARGHPVEAWRREYKASAAWRQCKTTGHEGGYAAAAPLKPGITEDGWIADWPPFAALLRAAKGGMDIKVPPTFSKDPCRHRLRTFQFRPVLQQ